MNNVTDGLPDDTGASGSVILAPREAQEHQRSTCSKGSKSSITANLYHAPPERVTSDENDDVVDLPAVVGALAALDAALAEHGAPDPERTAAWLCALGAVVPRG